MFSQNMQKLESLHVINNNNRAAEAAKKKTFVNLIFIVIYPTHNKRYKKLIKIQIDFRELLIEILLID